MFGPNPKTAERFPTSQPITHHLWIRSLWYLSYVHWSRGPLLCSPHYQEFHLHTQLFSTLEQRASSLLSTLSGVPSPYTALQYTGAEGLFFAFHTIRSSISILSSSVHWSRGPRLCSPHYQEFHLHTQLFSTLEQRASSLLSTLSGVPSPYTALQYTGPLLCFPHYQEFHLHTQLFSTLEQRASSLLSTLSGVPSPYTALQYTGAEGLFFALHPAFSMQARIRHTAVLIAFQFRVSVLSR